MGNFPLVHKPKKLQLANEPNKYNLTKVNNYFSDDFWVEGKALQQLDQLALNSNIKKISAFPDLHPGKYGPVGAAILADKIYPMLIGNDIGCGMGFFELDIPVNKLKLGKITKRWRALENGNLENTECYLNEARLDDSHINKLGTIGGGNHFCELQVVDDIFMDGYLDKAKAYLLVHSGSRSYGNMVFDEMAMGAALGFDAHSEEGIAYLAAHDRAVAYAAINRRLIAEHAATLLNANMRLIVDVPHNLIEATKDGFLHRKGAAKASFSLVPIAGSRASLSYVVQPSANIEQALCSLSHGAGRKYDRRSMFERGAKTRSARDALKRNDWGGQLICDDKKLLIEEGADAYKEAGQVVKQLQSFDLVTPIAALRPLVTFKCANTESEEGKGIKTLGKKSKKPFLRVQKKGWFDV
ncbi:RNA ligase RtcB family protein [Bartonella sp. HY329]|uniref:RNA ligase RtcB family protein n=1 Tax=unclassified Bartonella TaxID=2645622 RepID=UPI0021C86411|nr:MULTISPECIES: RNA ligase RtcB family protein [unclassified Bartonella]UXM93912.1 RNA ligase RtcB family protein [Bartonella sp. HY329]UXN08233.1 RNA ligase RtcB family protein [Bartonella sp. HY328]